MRKNWGIIFFPSEWTNTRAPDYPRNPHVLQVTPFPTSWPSGQRQIQIYFFLWSHFLNSQSSIPSLALVRAYSPTEGPHLWWAKKDRRVGNSVACAVPSLSGGQKMVGLRSGYFGSATPLERILGVQTLGSSTINSDPPRILVRGGSWECFADGWQRLCC